MSSACFYSIFVFSPILLCLLQAGAIGDEEEAEEIPLIKPRELREEDSIFSSNKPKQNNATNLFISEVVSGKLHYFCYGSYFVILYISLRSCTLYSNYIFKITS